MDLIYYNGEHSITIGEKNSWEDWHLIPTSKPVINPPPVKTKQVEIPGANGVIDLSTILTGYPTYGNRTGSLEFILAPGFDSWESTCSEVMNYLHGRQYDLYLSDDLGFYYTGSFSVNTLKSDSRLNSITIDYDLYPFKHDIQTSVEDQEWDPFNFEIGVFRNYSAIEISGEWQFTIDDCSEPVSPIITVDAAMSITHEYTNDFGDGEDTYQLAIGTSEPGIIMMPGVNVFTVTGTGTMAFEYRGGRL